MTKQASPDHPVHELIARRWSPYAFSERAVSREDLLSLFEAARWAPSSYNEQPWRFIVATKDAPEAFARLLSCLVEPNQAWAKRAPALVLGVVSQQFALNGEANKAATHDLGLAAGNLSLEATTRGIHVHQMIGILPEKAREVYSIPEGYEPFTALAIGYASAPEDASEEFKKRDTAQRTRRPLAEFVFGEWGEPSPLLPGR